MSSCPLLVFAFIFSLFSSTQSQTPRIRGLLLNCGAAAPTDAVGGIVWLPDFAFITTGESRSISIPGLLPTLSTLRSFPGAAHPHRKFCYIVPTFRGSRYLVRTTYFYGGINGAGDPPVFDQIVDGTFWTVVNTTADYVAGAASSYEGVFLARGTKMKVCLAGNDYTDSDPFLNTLEMIVLGDSVYNSTDFTKKALGLIARSRFGYDGPLVRNVSNMGLSGSLPPSIANLTALTDLSFAHNNLSGHVPDLGRLRRLERLHLQDNHFDGNIPSSLGNLRSLRELFLQNNNLTGPIPSGLLNKPGFNLGLSPGNNFTSAPSVG